MTAKKSEPARFQAGCAREPITPPLGVGLAGYFHERIAKRVRDELYANALVIRNDRTAVALVSCDLCTVTAAVAGPAKARIAKACGIPPDHVLICATHTHTGPEVRTQRAVKQDARWIAALPRRIAAAVRKACKHAGPATVRLGSTEAEGIAHNRLVRLKDGTEKFYRGNDRRQVRNTVGDAGPVDTSLQTLSLVGEDGTLRGLAVNFAVHPDVIGGGSADFISADWPGEMARNVRAVYGERAVCAFLQGTAGDINQAPHHPTHLPTHGPAKAVQMGRALAGAAMLAAERAEPIGDGTLAGGVTVLSIPYYTREPALRRKIAALKRRKKRTYFEEEWIRRFEAWPYDGQMAEVPVQVLRIGNAGIVGLPAEIFTRIGLDIKRYSPAAFTFVVELANARVSSYVPTVDQADRGAYGAMPTLSRWLAADAGRHMADAAQRLLQHLFRRPHAR
ncbi:MAG: neutral/alkaline non-lysosomal ceramidase N-terminal domain-containing protein [Kiritimatiellae bacterium]|nr:neutral/alkaline non-lysosomal ceramidase N-terminal domain-containing protein [Kiritimatiellia bacterium]